MLEYDKIDISEGTDINKTNALEVRDIFRFWYFVDLTLIMNHIFAIVVMI